MQLSGFMGQPQITNDLVYHVKAALHKHSTLDHTVLYGPPGLGKTTLVNMMVSDTHSVLIQKTGQEISRVELWNILSRLEPKTMFFIDEIHAAPIKAMEILYGPMQTINDYKVKNIVPDYFSFEGQMIKPFTLVGATTSSGTLAKPLRDRFILAYHFNYYSIQDLITILMNYGCNLEGAKCIARRARGTPRVAVNFLVRLENEFFTRELSQEKCLHVFKRLGVDDLGLVEIDREIMRYLAGVRCASESELTKTLGIDPKDYTNLHEMFLLNQRFMRITPKGRVLTPKGMAYINDYKA